MKLSEFADRLISTPKIDEAQIFYGEQRINRRVKGSFGNSEGVTNGIERIGSFRIILWSDDRCVEVEEPEILIAARTAFERLKVKQPAWLSTLLTPPTDEKE